MQHFCSSIALQHLLCLNRDSRMRTRSSKLAASQHQRPNALDMVGVGVLQFMAETSLTLWRGISFEDECGQRKHLHMGNLFKRCPAMQECIPCSLYDQPNIHECPAMQDCIPCSLYDQPNIHECLANPYCRRHTRRMTRACKGVTNLYYMRHFCMSVPAGNLVQTGQ